MAKSIASSKGQIQSRRGPSRRRNKLSAPAPPGGPRGPVPQNPLFWLLALLAYSAAWFAIQQGMVGILAVFSIALVVLVLRQNDWW